jgi:hypothetical protein
VHGYFKRSKEVLCVVFQSVGDRGERQNTFSQLSLCHKVPQSSLHGCDWKMGAPEFTLVDSNLSTCFK